MISKNFLCFLIVSIFQPFFFFSHILLFLLFSSQDIDNIILRVIFFYNFFSSCFYPFTCLTSIFHDCSFPTISADSCFLLVFKTGFLKKLIEFSEPVILACSVFYCNSSSVTFHWGIPDVNSLSYFLLNLRFPRVFSSNYLYIELIELTVNRYGH